MVSPLVKKTLIIGTAVVMATAACSKKKKSSGAASDGSVVPGEDTLVTLSTGSLQLAGEVAILKGSAAKTTLALGLKEVAFKLLDERTVRLRVTNEAFADLEKAGEIMCTLSQTKFWEQANLGTYQVQVDEKKCSRENKSGGGDPNGAGENESPELSTVYVTATREESRPLIAEMRVSAGDPDQEGAFYHVRVIVVEPPSTTAPAGIFDMRYTAHMGSEIGQSGFIRTKRLAGDKFVLESGGSGSEGGGRSQKSQGIAELQAIDEQTVIGYVHSDTESTNGNDESYAAKGQARFNESFLNVDYQTSFSSSHGQGEEKLQGCYDLKKYKTAMFRYDLVGADGKSVALNSGFPIEYGKMQGWAGYHGLWLGQNVTPSSGETVNKVTWTNGVKATTPYTVFAAPGRLTKLTRATTTLGALKGVDINFWDSGSSYIVKWDGTSLSKTAKVTYGKNGPEEEAASGAVTIPQWGANLYVPSLNANIQISNAATLSDSLTLSYHSEKTVSGTSEVPTCNLVCFQNCPVMAPTLASFQSSQSNQGPMNSALYKTTTVNWGQTYTTNQAQTIDSALGTYTWDATTQNLKEGSTAFALPSGLPSDSDQAQQLQGIRSGALVCASTYDAIADKTIDPYRLENEVETYYRFSSGAQGWNRFVSLRDAAGSFVSFDQPLELSYTHTTANDWDGNTDTAFIGKTFRLQYNGPGNLNGIPWKYAKEVGHHMPLFSIKSGTALGNYTIYPLDGEQRLAKTEAANCAAIPLEGAPALPALDLVPLDVGTLGDASSPLRYIGGVLVE